MKSRNVIRLFMPLVLFITLGARAQTSNQDKKKDQYNQLKALIMSKHYTFNAETATAMGGTSRQLTSLYTLSISGDTLNANLPYYGVAYSASPGDTNGAIVFNTTSFSYEEQDTKKGGWFIVITPKDQKNASKIQLSVSSGGYCTVQVTSNYRQLISFYGSIGPNPPER